MGIDGSSIKKAKDEAALNAQRVRERAERMARKINKQAEENAREERQRQILEEEQRRKVELEEAVAVPEPGLDCFVCHLESGMTATAIPRFDRFIRVIGVLFLIVAIVGVLLLAGAVIAQVVEGQSGMHSWVPFLGAILMFVCIAVVNAGIGWFLLSKKKVYKCEGCGTCLDRV